MIKFEKIDVMNFNNAIRGMRNPLNSWGKSDSGFNWEIGKYVLGPSDLALAKRLVKAGSDHRKFLRQIIVSVDITAPLYWWKEFDTYKVGTVANSCSTMHKIQAKQFERADFSCERMSDDALAVLDAVIDCLEKNRLAFIETKDKSYWHNMIQLLPTSYNQMRTITLSYENLLNQYPSRKGHKLQEWRDYCAKIETLPYFKVMCLDGDNDE